LPPLRGFILPAGHPAATWAHIARTVCRRLKGTLSASGGGEAGGVVSSPSARSRLHESAVGLSFCALALLQSDHGGTGDPVGEMSDLLREARTAVLHRTQLLSRSWISDEAFEIRCMRPPQFQFAPGQRVRFVQNEVERDYSPVSSPADEEIGFLVKSVKGGLFTSVLASAPEGASFHFTGPTGTSAFILRSASLCSWLQHGVLHLFPWPGRA